VLVDPLTMRHFSLDPRVSPNYMAYVDEQGVQICPETYFLSGEEFIIPAKGGVVIALLCHVPDCFHAVEPGGCALLKKCGDPWNISTALHLTNYDKDLALVVPRNCDVYSLIKNTSLELAIVEDEDFYAYYNFKK